MISSKRLAIVSVALVWVLSLSAPAAVSVLELKFAPSEVSILHPSDDGFAVALADNSLQTVTDVESGKPYEFEAEVVLEQSYSRAEMMVTMTPSRWAISTNLSVRKMAGHYGAQVEYISLWVTFEVTESVPYAWRIDTLETPPSDFLFTSANFSIWGIDVGIEEESDVLLPGLYEANLDVFILGTGNGFDSLHVDSELSGAYRNELSFTIPEPKTPLLVMIGCCGFALGRRRNPPVILGRCEATNES